MYRCVQNGGKPYVIIFLYIFNGVLYISRNKEAFLIVKTSKLLVILESHYSIFSVSFQNDWWLLFSWTFGAIISVCGLRVNNREA